METFRAAADFIRQNEVGRRAAVETPYGRRFLTYADLTATGRYLHFVEAWVKRVRPFYANSHTTISSTGRVMTELREEARRVIRRALKAGPHHEVIFVGSGATAAVNKLVGLLGWRISEPLEREYRLSKAIPTHARPLVVVGPYEHHSNELPWLESIADVVEVRLDGKGGVDIAHLDAILSQHADRDVKLGSFSAASNVTGAITDLRSIVKVLRKHGAIVCVDYAASAPYVPIDLSESEASVDAAFFSMHKFIGGPEGSGVLVAHRDLFRTRSPERPGGGTVDYVSGSGADSVDYVRRLDEREEGGTPAILADVRAGIGFLVKELAGADRILAHELKLAKMVLARLARHPNIRLMGPSDVDRLPIVSFNVERLHHDFVSVLLDHFFGIQNRAGCSCAGPYGHRLLGISRPKSELYRKQIARGIIGVKPGWVRVSFPYYASEADIEFILKAIEFVASHGKEFLPLYRLGWQDGVWRHLEHPVPDVRPIELTVAALVEAAQCFAAGDFEVPMSDSQLEVERARYFDEANAACAAVNRAGWAKTAKWNSGTGDADIDALVWFDYVHADELVPQSLPAREAVSRCSSAAAHALSKLRAGPSG